jgi:hypothetical protein
MPNEQVCSPFRSQILGEYALGIGRKYELTSGGFVAMFRGQHEVCFEVEPQ